MSRLFVLLATVLLVGCTYGADVGIPEEIQVDLHVKVEEVLVAPCDALPHAGGVAPGTTCSTHRELPLHLSSTMSEQTQAVIRSAAQMWEDALGVDIGALPVGDSPSEGLLIDDPTLPLEGSITLCRTHIRDAGGSWDMYSRVVAHEIGHYLGLDHVDNPNAIMAPYAVPGKSWELTDADVAEYERACLQ